jgi:hypothetical protein
MLTCFRAHHPSEFPAGNNNPIRDTDDPFVAQELQGSVLREIQLPPEQYEQRVFWRCLHRHALPLAALIRWVDPDVFQQDFDFIREIGSVQDAKVFQVEVDRFYGSNVRDKSWIRGIFRIRISGKRLMRLKRRVFRS